MKNRIFEIIGLLVIVALILFLNSITPLLLLFFLFALIYFKSDERISFGISVVMIIAGIVFLYFNQTKSANLFGNYAFYFFIVGTAYSFYNNYIKDYLTKFFK